MTPANKNKEFPWWVHVAGMLLLAACVVGFGYTLYDLDSKRVIPQPVEKVVAGRMSEPSWGGMKWYVIAEDGTYTTMPAAKWRMAKKGSTISAHWREE